MIFTPYFKKFGNVATKNSIVLPDYFTENHVNAAKKLEGFRSAPYLDLPKNPQKAKLTIGYGHNLDDPAMRKSFLQAMPSWTNEMIDDAGKLLRSGKKLNPDWTISKEDADRLLRARILQAHQELSNSRLKFETYPNNVKQGAVHMHLNLGMPRLLGFKKTWNYADKGDYKAAAREVMDALNAKLPRDKQGNILINEKTGEYQRASGIKRNIFASALINGGDAPFMPPNFDPENKWFNDDVYATYLDLDPYLPGLIQNPFDKSTPQAAPSTAVQPVVTPAKISPPVTSNTSSQYWTPKPGDTVYKHFNGDWNQMERFRRVNTLKSIDNIKAGQRYKIP